MPQILISPGPFKDVFSPNEIANILFRIVKKIVKGRIKIDKQPIADGGEYSSEVLLSNIGYRKEFVDRVADSRGKPFKAHYVVSKQKAYIFTSEILRLTAIQDHYKNPLRLTSYGLGQLILHAINNNKKEIIIGLGGTSTVDGGVGLAQAMGVIFYDRKGNILKPKYGKYLSGGDLENIAKISLENICRCFRGIRLTILCDTQISISRLDEVTKLKIGMRYYSQRVRIAEKLQRGLKNYAQVLEKSFHQKGLIRRRYYGNAGGLLLSFKYLFPLQIKMGADYFIKVLKVNSKIRKSDIVITGEGRFDQSSLLGKAPFRIVQISKKYKKYTIYLCGDVDNKFKKYIKKNRAKETLALFRKNGIDTLITCFGNYKLLKTKKSYFSMVKMYKEITPRAFYKELKILLPRLII